MTSVPPKYSIARATALRFAPPLFLPVACEAVARFQYIVDLAERNAILFCPNANLVDQLHMAVNWHIAVA
jgi:hypothetical protein